MPVTKFRFVLPTTLGTYKNGTRKLAAFHITGQSEKSASYEDPDRRSKRPVRIGSAEASYTEGTGAWRLFNLDRRFKGVWLTDSYYTDENGIFQSPPGYKMNDPRFASIDTDGKYNPKIAQANATKRAEEEMAPGEPVELRPVEEPTVEPEAPEIAPKTPASEEPEAEEPTLQEKKPNKNIRNLFKKD